MDFKSAPELDQSAGSAEETRITMNGDLVASLKGELSAGSVEETRITINGDLVASLRSELDSAPNRITRECCIFRVPDGLRKVNENAFTPQIVSIGPFHRGKLERYQAMENHKRHYLNALLSANTSTTLLEDCVQKLRELEKAARACYAEHIHLSSDEFVKMMLLDGCFIIEFLDRYFHHSMKEYDPLFHSSCLNSAFSEDLLLLENQLPFEVLDSLFKVVRSPSTEGSVQIYPTLLRLAHYYTCDSIEEYTSYDPDNDNENPKHLLDLALKLCKIEPKQSSSDTQNDNRNPIPSDPKNDNWNPKHLLDLALKQCMRCKIVGTDDRETKLVPIPSATRLWEAGVKFVPAEKHTPLLDIKFENGVLKIPVIAVEDGMEPLFRNLIAFEQSYYSSSDIADYATFMDQLIDAPEDVSLLRRKGIITNWLGDDKEVSDLFNKLGTNVCFGGNGFLYKDHFCSLNKFYKTPRHRWKARLKQDYFHNPWSTIAFTAAVIGLICTITQTFFSIIK